MEKGLEDEDEVELEIVEGNRLIHSRLTDTLPPIVAGGVPFPVEV